MGVLVIEFGVAVVGQALLETAVEAPALIDSNRPGVNEDLGHIGDAESFASLDHSGIFPGKLLHDIQVFQGQSRHGIRDILPLVNLGFGQVRHNLGDLSRALLDDDSKGATVRTRSFALAIGGIFQFLWLSQGNAIEFEDFGTGMLTDELGGGRDFHNR